MMVRSLRAFGGQLADVPVIAVIGRTGAPLRSATLAEFDRLNVRVIKAAPLTNPAPWFNYGNKAAALLTAEKFAETEQVTWLDSDIYVLSEPQTILLSEGEYLAITLNNLPPRVTPEDSTHSEYWKRLCSLFDVDFDEIAWVNVGNDRQKLNCNSGVFTWRRGTDFAKRYYDGFRKVLNAKLAQVTGEFFTVDQVILVPLAHGRQWRLIDFADHSFVASDLFAAGAAPTFNGVRVLHYSTSPYGPFREEFHRRLAFSAPTFSDWLEGQNFDPGQTGWASHALAKALKAGRGLRYRLFAMTVKRAA